MIYNLGHGVSAVQQLSDAVLHDLPQQVDLFGVGELLHIAQIDGLLVDGQAVKAGTADLCPISQALGGAQFPVKFGSEACSGASSEVGRPPLPFWQIP